MDLFKEVLKDDGLKLEAKTVFMYLYLCNNDSHMYREEILEELNLCALSYYKYVKDLVDCGYLKVKGLYSELKAPLFAFKDTNFEFSDDNEGIYFHKGAYEVYYKSNYIGTRKDKYSARQLRKEYIKSLEINALNL